MTIFHCLNLKIHSISFVRIKMVSCVMYNFLNYENFIACILKIHVTAAEVPCTSVHIFFKEAVVVYKLIHGTF